jgi:peptidoglycan/LPS O-acetylase OafA/YrhL
VHSLKNRSVGVDLARTIAVFAIVYVHTVETQSAAYGVQLFFMISGYLLADSHVHYSSTQFIFIRFFRLFPLSILMVFIYNNTFDSGIEIIASVLLLNGFFTGITTFPGGWSISSEWIYSLANICIVRIQIKTRLKILAILIFLGIIFDTISFILPNYIGKFHAFTYLLSFFAFYLVGNLLSSNSKKIQDGFLGRKITLFLFLIPLFGINQAFPQVFYLLSLSMLFASCLHQDSFPAIFVSIFHFLGRRTFGMFVSHFVIMAYFEGLTHFQWLTSSDDIWIKFCYFITIFLFSAILGAVSYAVLERPIAKLAHETVKRRRLSQL